MANVYGAWGYRAYVNGREILSFSFNALNSELVVNGFTFKTRFDDRLPMCRYSEDFVDTYGVKYTFVYYDITKFGADGEKMVLQFDPEGVLSSVISDLVEMHDMLQNDHGVAKSEYIKRIMESHSKLIKFNNRLNNTLTEFSDSLVAQKKTIDALQEQIRKISFDYEKP